MNWFRIQIKILKLVGHSLSFSDLRTSCWKVVHQILLLIFVLSAQVPMARFAIYHSDDLAQATACLSLLFTNILTVIKMITLFFKNKQFEQLMDDLEEVSATSNLVVE